MNLAGVPKTIEELEAALMAATDAHTAAQEAMAAADTALEEATAARMAAQTAVDESDAAGLTDAIAALQAARDAEAAAEGVAMAAAVVATAAEADVTTAQAAVDTTDTGPASEELAEQNEDEAIEGCPEGVYRARPNPNSGRTGASRRSSRPKPVKRLRPSVSAMAVRASSSQQRGGPNAAVDGATDPVWAAAEMNMAPEIPGWLSGTLTAKGTAGGTDTPAKPGAGETGTGLVYSNIEAPENKLFAVVHGPNPTLTVAEVPAGSDDTVAVLTANNWKNAKILPANTYGGGTVAGSYDGVDGTFRCTGTCPTDLPLRRSDGTIIPATVPDLDLANDTRTWTFKPTDEAAMVTVQNDSYLFFGYWLSKNNKSGLPQDFQVWYGGGDSAKSAVGTTVQITQLDEKVTYNGAAAGKYVTKDEIANTAEAGYFTASAVLTADFTADAGEETLKGTISDFKPETPPRWVT